MTKEFLESFDGLNRETHRDSSTMPTLTVCPGGQVAYIDEKPALGPDERERVVSALRSEGFEVTVRNRVITVTGRKHKLKY